MGGGDQVPHHFDPVFNVKAVEEQRKDPTLPQRYQSKPSETGGLTGALTEKFINYMQDRVPDPFEELFEMPCSVIMSGAESGDQLPHTDVSTAPDMLPPPDRHPSNCRISTFVTLSPQYRLNIQGGTALGEATEERWDEVLLEQGEVLLMVSTARHHGLPSPLGQKMHRALFTPWTPIGVIRGFSRIPRIWTHPPPLELKECLGLLEWGGGGGPAHVRATVAVGCWIGGSGGAGQPGRGGRRLQHPRGAARPPGVHTPSPVPLPLRARHLPRHRARGENPPVERGV